MISIAVMQSLLCDSCFVSLSRVLVFFLLFCRTHADLHHASDNVTSPAEGATVGWQSNPSRRGSMDIIQSCLFTILICTWSVQHLNVPHPDDSKVKILSRKIWWMIITILFPEFVLAHAIMERDMAHRSMRHLKGLDKFMVDDRTWWKACLSKFSRSSSQKNSSESGTSKMAENNSDIQHEMNTMQPPDNDDVAPALVSDSDIQHEMNTMRPPDDDDVAPALVSDSNLEPDDIIQWGLTHSYYANMGGLRISCTEVEGSDREVEGPITTEQLSILLRKGHIGVHELPDLSVDSIVDKSKGDSFTKGLAVVQVFYLMISVVIRASKQLAVTQLEILAVAFAICSTLTYGFFWNKPQDVRTALRIRVCSNCADKSPQHLADLEREIGEHQPDRMVKELTAPFEFKNAWWKRRIANDNFELSAGTIQPVGIVLAVSTVVFGGVHLAAWDFKFPTLVEDIMWKTAVLVSIGLPLVVLTANALQWLLLLQAAYAINDSLWPTTLQDAKEYLTDILNYVVTFFVKEVDYAKFASIQDAIEQGGPSSAYYELYKKMDQNRGSILVYLSANPLHKWRTKYFLSKIYEESSDPLKQLKNGKPVDLPQIICGIPVPSISWREDTRLRTDIVAYKKRLQPRKSYEYSEWQRLFTIFLFIISFFIYVVARLSIIAIAFSCFRAMPDSVYVGTWTKYVPTVE